MNDKEEMYPEIRNPAKFPLGLKRGELRVSPYREEWKNRDRKEEY